MRPRRLAVLLLLALAGLAAPTLAQTRPTSAPVDAPWNIGKGLLSRFAKDVDPLNPLAEHPRPQMTREAWINLNGLWDYAILPEDAPRPERFDGKILVPFAVESALSGVQKAVLPGQRLWYRRTFDRPVGERILLHFGAVDWHAEVFVNGRAVGDHKGGFDSFSFDVTEHLRDGENELIVAVLDPTDRGTQPIGKQRLAPEGIWYTAVSGIWQTVWLEPVAAAGHIRALRIEPDVDAAMLRVTAELAGAEGDGWGIAFALRDDEQVITHLVADGGPSRTAELKVPRAKLWSPSNPHLYDLRVTLVKGEQAVDAVSSYAAMRKVSMAPGPDGAVRLMLNNQPIFMFGPLDQGWWPDGLYTAPTDAALRYDVEITKQMGFNTARKHVKVEPARWYYWADKLGLLVWQDMPSNFASKVAPDSEADPEMDRAAAEQWRREWRATMDALRNNPSVVVWVPFNEGWGQHDTKAMIAWTKQYDATRLVGGPSGWADRGAGDLHDMHSYPGPGMFPPTPGRASVLGEFGGLGLPLPGHLWQEDKNWGYQTLKDEQELQRRYERMIVELRPLVRQGLAAAIYTQTTDVEGEVNGLLTYDRAVLKLDPAWLAKVHARVYEPIIPADRIELLATSEQRPQPWSHTTDAPAEGWTAGEFDDRTWPTGFGGFGREGTPGAHVRTPWTGGDIWLRQRFTVEADQFHELHLRIHHDEDAVVYLNGRKIAELDGFATGYRDIPLPPDAAAALRRGENVIAVHCRQTGGGQYVDVGLFDLRPRR